MLFIIGILLGAAVVIFILQNVTPVAISFMGYGFEGSVAVIVLLAVITGMVLSALLSIPSMIRSQLQLRALQKHNRKLAQDLEDHKKIIQDAPVVQEKVIVEETTVVSDRSHL